MKFGYAWKPSPALAKVRLTAVCCNEGRVSLFVGISENGAKALELRAASTGSVRLDPKTHFWQERFPGNLHVRFLEGGGAERLRLHSVRRSRSIPTEWWPDSSGLPDRLK